MIDLYRRLNIGADSDAEAVRAALSATDPATREAAELILLNDRRRPVYDRNRQVLATIGQLRARLGINYTRFWSRALYGDFVVDLEPDAAAVPHLRHRVDPMAVLQAFGPRRGPRRHRHRYHWGRYLAIAATLLLLILVIWWLASRGGV